MDKIYDTSKLVTGYSLYTQNEHRLEDSGHAMSSYRKSKGLTQEELGIRLGIDKSHICKIEKGKNLTISTICKVFRAMDADVKIVVEPIDEILPDKYLDDLILVIFKFAKQNSISGKQAFNYLDRFGGINLYLNDPELESSLPMSDTIDALTEHCRINGGKL